MAKTFAQRIAEYRSKEGNSVEEQFERNRQKRLISSDTIDADLKSLNESLTSTFGGWQDAETLKNTKSSLESMVGRLDAYKQYLTGRADEETLSQISSIRDDYSKVLEGFDQYTESYGKYSSADEWNQALKEAEKAEADRKALLDYDQVAGQAEIDELQKIVDEIDDLQGAINATYSGVAVGARAYANEQERAVLEARMHELVAQYGGVSEIRAALSNKRAYHALASRAQKGVELASVVGNEDFLENSQYISTAFKPETFWDKFHFTEYNLGYDDLTHQYINGDEEFRAEVSRKHSNYNRNTMDGESRFEEANLDQMSEDEVKIYNYYYNTEGKEKAEEYLDSIQETLNYRKAQKTFGALEGKTFLEMVFGVEAGVDQFSSGIKNLFSGKDYIPTSEMQFASGMVREDLADNGAKLPDWLGGASLGQVAYDSITTTANMLPSIMVSFVPVVGQAASVVTLGASAAGHAKAEMLNLGYSKRQANLYGAMVGASESGLQYLLGGITRLGGKLPQGLTELAVSKVDNAIARVAITLGMNMASEGLEESLQTVIEPWLKSLVTGVDFEAPDIDEVLYSGLLGAVSSLLMEGGSTVYGEVAKKHEASAVYGENAADLVAEALEINPNDAYALKMKALLDEGKTLTGGQINRLIEGNEKNLRGQESAETKTEAEARLAEPGETGDVGTERINEKEYNKELYSFAEDVAGVEKNAAVAPQAFAPQTQTLSVTENASKKENAAEGKFEASADGKTRIGDTEISIKEVASIKDGEMMLQLEDGSTVEASDVEFGSSDEALLYENVLDMGLNAASANAFLNGYDGKLSADRYARGFREAYMYGEYGFPMSEISTEGFSQDLDAVQKHLAYNLGKANAEARAAERQRKVSKSVKSESRKGKLHNTLTPTNETQRASLKALGVVAEALGVDIYTFESPLVNGKRQGANGWYDPNDNSIYIDLFAGMDGKGTMLFTAAHELTHHIRAKFPAKFKAFADFLFEKYGEKGVSVSELVAKKQSFLKEKGRITADMTEAQAYDLSYEEVVADSCESFLADGDAVTKIAELKAKEKSLWQTIKDFITKLVTRIKAAYEGLSPDTVEGSLTAEMLSAAEDLKAMWTEMLIETSEVSGVDEGNISNESTSPLFSERDFPIDEEVEKTVDDAFKTPKSSMLILSDITSDQNKAINRLVNQTNNDLYRGKFTGGKHRFLDTIVRHVIREHGDFLREGLRAQLPMKPVDIARHLSAVKANKEPNKTIPTKTKEGTPSILTAFEVNGYTLYAEEIIRPLGKNLPSDLIGHTMYKAPTLPSATFYTTSVQTQPKRQSMVLCNYYSTNSTNLSTGNFVANSNNLPALLNYISLNGTPKQDARSAGLIALSSDRSNFTDQTGDVRQGYVRCKKPFYITSENRVFSNSETDISARIEELKKQGYDCFIFEQRPGDNYMVAVVNKAQIVKDQPKVVHSDRVTDSVSNRTLLADALESTVKDEIERKRLTEYKEAIAEIEAAQEKLTELRAKIKELSFAKGPRDTKAINELRFEANKLANRISVLDGKLLRLESMGAIKGVLEREKARAYEKAKQEGKEALAAYRERAEQKQRDLAARYQESRKKGVEGRHKTEMRHKIKSIVSELNQLLLHGSKERNVKPALRSAVASALEAVNMDTLEVEKRVAELNSSIEKATDPVVAEALIEKRDRIQKQGDTLSVRLAALKAAYEQIKAKPESEIDGQLSLDADMIIAKVESVSELIGDTPIRSMTLFQLEAVYDMYRMVLKTIQNVNKVFRAGKEEDLLLNVKAVEKELSAIPKLKEERLAEASKLEAYSWNELMPVYAFERIGSATFKKFYWDFIKAQNVYAIDGEEAKAFAENVRKKYNYASWDMNKVYEFPLADGRTLRATLKHMLSIYAYSKREQALEHMAQGGFFFDDKETFTTTLGGVLKFNKSNEVGYQIDAETLGAIKEAMSKEQLQYVDEMQAYLSEVMADKGNAVSRVLWGVDIFKEKVYFPLKSKEDFLKRANETAANISLKNDGMTKETVPGASNPIVLEAFDEVWAGHVERMAQYHAFVLPIDNMNKVHQYGTWNGASISISTMLGSRHGSAVNDYIRQFIKDMNGSVMSGGVKAPGIEMFNKFKKTAVAASLSVVVQQPTAIIRATALIDPKYFLGSKVKSSEGKDLEEMRKYAPISVLKEIGGFDAGSGRTLVDYINGDTKRGVDKAMAVIDDISMKGAELGDRVGWLTIWNAVKREVASKNKGIATSSEQFLSLVGERFTEVIVYTQVYDSTLSRSAFMRSKRDLTKMMTSFMGEPTLSYNMMANALYQLKRHTMKKSQATRTISSVLVSTTLASLAASFIYGLRDDDDEKTVLEKWLSAFGMDMLGVVEINGFKIPLVASNLLPHNMLPWFRDAMSLLEGWEVERADMSVLADVWKAIDGLDSEKKSAWRKVEDMASIASMFGIPLKNAMRTFREMYNLLNGIVG